MYFVVHHDKTPDLLVLTCSGFEPTTKPWLGQCKEVSMWYRGNIER